MRKKIKSKTTKLKRKVKKEHKTKTKKKSGDMEELIETWNEDLCE